jgi:dephospho-CoA kinase
MSGLLIGLTGGIAAGKSSVAAMFGELGALLMDSDKVAHTVLHDLWEATSGKRLVQLLGVSMPELCDINGNLDRRKLSALVFADKGRRERLEREIHPLVAAGSHKMIALARKLMPERHIVYESALLVEVGRHREMDRLVVVFADDRTRIKRLMARSGLTEAEAMVRLAAQIPQLEKVRLADFVIDNSGTPEETGAQVARIWEILNAEMEKSP